MNANWPRWIFASICEHASFTLGTGRELFVEGTKRVADASADRYELRTNGPFFNEISAGVWRTEVTVNILVSCTMDDANFQTLQTNIGIALGIVVPTIPLYQYGSQSGIDDDQLFACMTLMNGPVITQYGQVNPSIEVVQATVQGRYKVLLEE